MIYLGNTMSWDWWSLLASYWLWQASRCDVTQTSSGVWATISPAKLLLLNSKSASPLAEITHFQTSSSAIGSCLAALGSVPRPLQNSANCRKPQVGMLGRGRGRHVTIIGAPGSTHKPFISPEISREYHENLHGILTSWWKGIFTLPTPSKSWDDSQAEPGLM